jgi:hypothetical protein
LVAQACCAIIQGLAKFAKCGACDFAKRNKLCYIGLAGTISATLAQLVEQPHRKRPVFSSSLKGGSQVKGKSQNCKTVLGFAFYAPGQMN